MAQKLINEDSHNLKPIFYKYKLFKEMKNQLDHLLKKLKFTKNDQDSKKIVLHGISHKGINNRQKFLLLLYKVSKIRFIHLKKVLMKQYTLYIMM